tara:strand:+ start:2990 stop:3157 length:168 start_codon:yes stop_codon:yes gene_type:complete
VVKLVKGGVDGMFSDKMVRIAVVLFCANELMPSASRLIAFMMGIVYQVWGMTDAG